MIFDIFIKLFTAPMKLFLQSIPTISVTIPEDVLTQILEYIKLACYFLPVKTIVAILTINLAIWTFKITMAIVVRVKSFIPTMGA